MMSSNNPLFEIGKAMFAETDISKLLPLAMDHVIAQTGAERGMIMVYGANGELLFETARQLDQKDIEHPEFQISKTIMQQVRESGKYKVIKNALTEEELLASGSAVRLGLLSVACAPLRNENEVIGTVYIDHRKQEARFDESTGKLLTEFADLISLSVKNALERRRLETDVTHKDLKLRRQTERLRRLEAELVESKGYGKIKGCKSPAMRKVVAMIEKVAKTEATVLIVGETGAGKELVAWELYQRSSRCEEEFVTLNCASLTETLLGSELFGHEKGAFTGADKQKIGYFEHANGGTIFLDEIGKLSKEVQAKLLRVVQSGEFNRAGGTATLKTDVRVIAAASPDLPELIKQDKFYPDLYFRLKVVDIHLPPLRERREDIPELAEYFRERYADRHKKLIKQFSPEALGLLEKYAWPGNVRELENIIHSAVIFTDGEEIQAEDLPVELQQASIELASPTGELTYFDAKKKWECEFIRARLKEANGNVAEAARLAGIFSSNFHQKMKQCGIRREEYIKQ